MPLKDDSRPRADKALLRAFDDYGGGWRTVTVLWTKMEAALKAGADPDASRPDGVSALMLAMMSGDAKQAVGAMLLSHPGCGKARDRFGQNALHWAARSRDVELVRAMMERIDPSLADNDGVTPFMLALSEGWWAPAMELRPRSDLMARDRHGRSALHLAQQSYLRSRPGSDWIAEVDSLLMEGFALVETQEIRAGQRAAPAGAGTGEGAAAPSKRSRL